MTLSLFFRKDMSKVLGKLKAPLGVFAVTGNHEYIGRKVPEFIAAMDLIGIRVLMDEAALVEDSFYVIGRKDKASAGFGAEGRLSIHELVAPLDQSRPLIMLDHQPSDIAKAAENGIDISVSGHTHRGQMIPNHLITRKLFELDWGYLLQKKAGCMPSSRPASAPGAPLCVLAAALRLFISRSSSFTLRGSHAGTDDCQ